jgi:predicted O-methyltransferase YrrM
MNILEFGAGSSSLVLATALSAAGGGKLTSVEQNPQWCIEKWAIVKQKENVDCHI